MFQSMYILTQLFELFVTLCYLNKKNGLKNEKLSVQYTNRKALEAAVRKCPIK